MEHHTADQEERLEDLLSTKDFEQLSPAETAFVLEVLGSEARYRAMRKVGQALVIRTDLSPDPEILHRLKQRMAESETASTRGGVFRLAIPLYAGVLLIILFASAGWWAGAALGRQPRAIVEVVKTDTVYVRTKPDTVTIYRDRIVREVATRRPQPKQDVIKVVRAPRQDDRKEVGVSMEEKEELQMLLVAGSE